MLCYVVSCIAPLTGGHSKLVLRDAYIGPNPVVMISSWFHLGRPT